MKLKNKYLKIIIIVLFLILIFLILILIIFNLNYSKLKQPENNLKVHEPKSYQNNKSFLSSEKLVEGSLVYGESIINTMIIKDSGAESYINFVIDSRLLINGEEYYLGMPTISENTYASDNLFQFPSYEYSPVFEKGLNESLIFRTRTETSKVNYKGIDFHLKFKEIKILETNEELLEVMKNGERLIGITKLVDDLGEEIIIEYPIKTINFLNEEQNTWQVDTGPVLIFINNSFEISYIAFTNPNWVDFIIRDNIGNYNQYFHTKSKNIIATYKT